MKDITHIERPNLPWRNERVTECGLDASRHPTWTRDEAIATSRDLGRQRFAFVACVTCMNTAERHATWESDPISCLDRYTSKMTWHRDDAARRQFTDELRAIGLLIEAHREEFDATTAGIAGAVTIADLRAARSAARLAGS